MNRIVCSFLLFSNVVKNILVRNGKKNLLPLFTSVVGGVLLVGQVLSFTPVSSSNSYVIHHCRHYIYIYYMLLIGTDLSATII